MAQTNYTPISLYYSTTAAAVPVNTNLVNGELAINITDGKLFYKDNGGTVQVLATKGAGTIGGSNTQVQYNNSGALAGSANLTFNGTTLTANTLNLTNALGTTYGGTGLTSFTANGVVYASSSSALTTGSALTFDGTNLGVGGAVNAIAGFTSVNINGGASGAFTDYKVNNILESRILALPSELRVQNITNGTIGFYTNSAEQMRLTSTGLGIGTSSPSSKLEVLNAGDSIVTITGNTASGNFAGIDFKRNTGTVNASIRSDSVGANDAGELLFQTRPNAGSLTTRMTLDPSGNLGLGVTPSAWGSGWPALQVFRAVMHSNTSDGRASFGNNYYVDGTNGRYIATAAATQLMQVSGEYRFFNAPSGTAGNAITFTQAMTLDGSGRLLIAGTSSSNISGQAQNLLVYSSGTNAIGGYQTAAGGYCFASYAVSNGGTYFHMVFSDAGTSHGSITSNGTTTSYNVTSDRRLKENIQDAESASNLIDSLQVRKFDWKSDGSHQRYGFVAQELVTVAPEAVHQPADPDEMMAVDYSKLVPMLVKEIQSLRIRIAQLEAK